jgi:hypothetical protein
MTPIMIHTADTQIMFILNGKNKLVEMNQYFQVIVLGLLCIIINCNSGSKETNIDLGIKQISKTDITQAQSISRIESEGLQKRPTYQEIYSKSGQINKIIGEQKHDPSTKKESYISTLNVKGDEVRIELYHINNRIVTVENRIYNKDKQLNYSMFYFDEKNVCFSNTKRDYKEDRSYIYAMYWDTLIKFDVYCKLIDLPPSQKQEIIKSAKASLDSIMQHFPEFKYSINWK